MEEQKPNPVANTPTSGRVKTEAVSGSGSGGGGGSEELNNASNVNGSNQSGGIKRERDEPNELPVEAQHTSSAPQTGHSSPSPTHSPSRRARGRPRGSRRSPLGPPSPTPSHSPGPATEVGGGDHVSGNGSEMKVDIISINQGEDVHKKLVSLARRSNRNITILSCNGTVSQIDISPSGSARESKSYEGVFRVLNLNGSLRNVEIGGSSTVNCALTVLLLMTTTGEIIGGEVCGRMIAAGPIQITFVSFVQGSSTTPSDPSITNNQFQSPPQPQPQPPAAAVEVQQGSYQYYHY